MSFLINNPIVFVIIAIVLIVMTYFGFLLIQEIKLNNMLKMKHKSMRSHKTVQNNNKRLGLLTSMSLSPALLVVLFVLIGVNQPVSPVGEALEFTTDNDIFNVYEAFQKRSSSDDLESSDPAYNGDVEVSDEAPVLDMSPDANEDVLLTPSDAVFELETERLTLIPTATDGNFLYSITGMSLISGVDNTESDGVDMPAAGPAYNLSDLIECGIDYQEQGLYIDEETLVIASTLITNSCVNSDNTNEEESTIFVFDKNNNFELTDEFIVSGNLIGLSTVNGTIVVATKTTLDYSNEIDDYLPYVSHNGVNTNILYNDITYIEGTSPTTFITISSFNIDTKMISIETVLVDNAFEVYKANNAFYVIGNIYEFEPLSEYFELDDPVSTKRVLIYEFVLIEAVLELNKIEIK